VSGNTPSIDCAHSGVPRNGNMNPDHSSVGRRKKRQLHRLQLRFGDGRKRESQRQVGNHKDRDSRQQKIYAAHNENVKQPFRGEQDHSGLNSSPINRQGVILRTTTSPCRAGRASQFSIAPRSTSGVIDIAAIITRVMVMMAPSSPGTMLCRVRPYRLYLPINDDFVRRRRPCQSTQGACEVWAQCLSEKCLDLAQCIGGAGWVRRVRFNPDLWTIPAHLRSGGRSGAAGRTQGDSGDVAGLLLRRSRRSRVAR